MTYYEIAGLFVLLICHGVSRVLNERAFRGLSEPEKLPGWLTQDDLRYYAGEFEERGFRGGLNWYRNIDRNWELMAPWAGAKIRVPALFVGGLSDPVVTRGQDGPSPFVQGLPSVVEDLRGTVLIEGAGHWNQQEKPEETYRALLDFLAELDSP